MKRLRLTFSEGLVAFEISFFKMCLNPQIRIIQNQVYDMGGARAVSKELR